MTEIQSPQPEQPKGAPANYIVSVVMTKPVAAGTNTQNKLYGVEAVSTAEAQGKAIALAQAEFPEHQLHTVCHWTLQAPAVAPEQVWIAALEEAANALEPLKARWLPNVRDIYVVGECAAAIRALASKPPVQPTGGA